MMLLRLALLATFGFCLTKAVLVGQDNRGFDTYGPPPKPAQQYGPPPTHHIPHREYGVPQQIPFQEYGPPALKYGPPKLNYFGNGNGPPSKNGVYEQIKAYFGVPKPYYGPPHVQYKPKPEYGPPPPQSPAQYYGPPPQQHYGPPKPAGQYGPPPLKIQHRPAQQYGPPPQKPHFFIPPQQLPGPHPAPLFKPAHQPATSYGPPASGPLNLPPKPVYEPPSNYGPPPLPVNLPGPQGENFNRPQETTIILGQGGQGGHQSLPGGRPHDGGPYKQVQIQIDASGHTHSVTGSQAPFHTACDGWKPIAAPVGTYIEQNHVETQSGYSNVNQGHGIVTQYNIRGNSGGSLVDGLTDEQLVAVALQGEASNAGGSSGPSGPSGPGAGAGSGIDSEALQISVNAIDDSYLKPPADSYAPGSIHETKYQTIAGNAAAGLSGPAYGPPPPPPPQPQSAALTAGYVQTQGQAHVQSNVNIQYGAPSGGHPKSPVVYRPPVPAGLIESIGATVQHLDQFGVKPPHPVPNYIPPAAHEIAVGALPPVPPTIYGAPSQQQQQQQQQPAPQIVVGQQLLPLPQQGPNFQQQARPQSHHYIPPPPPQQQQQQQQPHFQQQPHMPPFIYSQGLPLAQQLPRFNQQQQQQLQLQIQQQQHQQLQQLQQHQQQAQIVVHDCGQGPNLVSSTGYQVQQHQQLQQQQLQQFGSISAASAGAYNAIAQSVPVAEQHTQFLAGSGDSYGPPASGNDVDFDHSGYASQKSSVAALPDGTDPQQLPGLDGLNVISAQKSQSIKFDSNSGQPQQNFQIQYGGSSASQQAGNGGGNGGSGLGAANDQNANHEEILSQGLLQSILTAIEQPQGVPQNHRAESRSDNEQQEDEENEEQAEAEHQAEHQEHGASERIEVRVSPDKAERTDDDEETSSTRLLPIVAAEEQQSPKSVEAKDN